jgi:hypothetical protein
VGLLADPQLALAFLDLGTTGTTDENNLFFSSRNCPALLSQQTVARRKKVVSHLLFPITRRRDGEVCQ